MQSRMWCVVLDRKQLSRRSFNNPCPHFLFRCEQAVRSPSEALLQVKLLYAPCFFSKLPGGLEPPPLWLWPTELRQSDFRSRGYLVISNDFHEIGVSDLNRPLSDVSTFDHCIQNWRFHRLKAVMHFSSVNFAIPFSATIIIPFVMLAIIAIHKSLL